MKLYALFFIGLNLLPISAMAEDCDLSSFPDFWADAQDQVSRIQVALSKAEKAKPYSLKSAKAFRQSLSVCVAQRKFVYNDPTTNGGSVTESKCEAALLCSRLAILNDSF